MKRKLIIAAHGLLAEGLKDSTLMMIGELPYETGIYSLAKDNNPYDFSEELKCEVIVNPDIEYIVLTDLYGAKLFKAMYSLTSYPNVRLFTGTNLNMMLSICLNHPNELTDEDISMIVEESKNGIKYVRDAN